MSPEEILEQIRAVARSMGIVDVGVADASLWESDPLGKTIPEGSRPTDILPDANSVIVLGVPIQKTIIDTAPSIYYNHLYSVVNTLLDQASERIALEMGILGHHAVYIPRDGYHGIPGLLENNSSFFSHRHAAYLSGFGTFGYNNMLITEKYGPRIRFTSVLTSAVLPYGSPMKKELCTGCLKCTKLCPVGAVPSSGYPSMIVDKEKCLQNSIELNKKGISPCGRCVAVCPIGKDRMPLATDLAKEHIRSYVKPPKN